MKVLRNILPAQSRGIEAEKRTLAIASLKLILFILVLSFCLSEILLLTGDNTAYGGKAQFIAWWYCLSAYSLGMILDASYILGKKKQNAAAGQRRGIAGTLLPLLVMSLSPLWLLSLVTIIAALGMIGSILSFLTVMF